MLLIRKDFYQSKAVDKRLAQGRMKKIRVCLVYFVFVWFLHLHCIKLASEKPTNPLCSALIHITRVSVYTFYKITLQKMRLHYSRASWNIVHSMQRSCSPVMFCCDSFGPCIHVDATRHTQPITPSWQWHSLIAAPPWAEQCDPPPL